MGKGKKGAAVISAPLPGASDLPEFEGVQPVGVVTKIRGASQRITRAIHIDETGLALVEWKNDDIGHKRTKKEGVKRHQALDVLDLHELVGGKCPECACDLLAAIRAEYRKKDPQGSLDDVDPAELGDQRKAADGVALTPEEEKALAAFNGDVEAAAELEAGRNGGEGLPPWDEYDTHGVGVIVNRLNQSEDRMLVLIVGAYESANKNRAGVNEAVTRRSAQLLAGGAS